MRRVRLRLFALACALALGLSSSAGAAPGGLRSGVQAQEAAIASLDLQLAKSRARRAVVEAARQSGERRLRSLAARQAQLSGDLRDGRQRVAAVVRFLYEDGTTSLLGVLFASSSFADFVTRFAFVERIVAYDVGLLRQVSTERRELAQTVAAAESQQRNLDAEAAQLQQVVARLQALEARHKQALAGASAQVVAYDRALQTGLPALQKLLTFFPQLPWNDVQPDGVQLDYATRQVVVTVKAATLNALFTEKVPDFGGFAFSFQPSGVTLAGHGVTLVGPVAVVSGGVLWRPDGLVVGGQAASGAALVSLLSGQRFTVSIPAPAAGLRLESATTGSGALRFTWAP